MRNTRQFLNQVGRKSLFLSLAIFLDEEDRQYSALSSLLCHVPALPNNQNSNLPCFSISKYFCNCFEFCNYSFILFQAKKSNLYFQFCCLNKCHFLENFQERTTMLQQNISNEVSQALHWGGIHAFLLVLWNRYKG